MKTKSRRVIFRLSLYFARIVTVLLILNLTAIYVIPQQNNSTTTVTISLFEQLSTLDTLTSSSSDSAAENIRNLLFNSLVKKDEKLDFTGDLAKEIKVSNDGKTVTFVLRDNIKFHNGKIFSAADVKYTFDQLFKSNSYKSRAFFKTVRNNKFPLITSIDVINSKTVNFVLSRDFPKNQLLSYLVAIPIIPEGTVEQQNTKPVGTGPFKFVSFDQSQNISEFQANSEYFEGVPAIKKIRAKTVTDANALETELQSGGVDIAFLPSYLSFDRLNFVKRNSNLKVERFNGSNIDYLGFNTKSPVLKNIKIRQAIAHAIDREKIINELLFGQAKIAHSILPVESWAYSEGTTYSYNPAKAKLLLKESGYKNELIKIKLSVGNSATAQYVQVIQSELQEIGLNIEIEAMEPNILRTQLVFGQFQINTGRWINGNQEPMFLKDLFATSSIPSATRACCNRSRYNNPYFDKIIEEANNTIDSQKARILYAKAQKIVSDDLPLLPLWYPANIIVSNNRIGNIKMSPSGDWSFVKDLRVNN